MEYLLSFSSTHKALKAETLLKAEGTKFRLLPAPKEITTSCALVISVDGRELEVIVALLKDCGTEPEKVFKSEDNKYAEV
ncbi:MAG: DUF3343 domain-containing protein [Thermodesulfobacteriota bacterium]